MKLLGALLVSTLLSASAFAQSAPTFKGQTLGESVSAFLATPQGKAAEKKDVAVWTVNAQGKAEPSKSVAALYTVHDESGHGFTMFGFSEDGKLNDVWIEGSGKTADAGVELLQSMTEKYGNPTSTHTTQEQNNHGAIRATRVSVWITSAYYIEAIAGEGMAAWSVHIQTPAERARLEQLKAAWQKEHPPAGPLD